MTHAELPLATSGRTALLAGATGLVGSHCLERLLNAPRYDRVIALTRRPLGRDAEKLDVCIADFDGLAATDLPAVDDVYCCLGTTIARAGSLAAFEQVDLHYVVALAALGAERGATQFLLISAVGAAAGSPVFYNRVKGEAEAAVAAIPFRAVHIFRPSLLMGPRAEHRLAESLSIPLARGLSPLMVGPLRRYRPVHADEVAGAMLAFAARDETGVQIHHFER